MPSKPYFQLVMDAILFFNERRGTSRQDIKKRIAETENLGELTNFQNRMINTALRKAVAEGILTKEGDSFRVSTGHKKAEKKASAQKLKEQKKKAAKTKKKEEKLVFSRIVSPDETRYVEGPKNPDEDDDADILFNNDDKKRDQAKKFLRRVLRLAHLKANGGVDGDNDSDGRAAYYGSCADNLLCLVGETRCG